MIKKTAILALIGFCPAAQALIVGGDFQEAGVDAISVYSGVETDAALASAAFAGANVWNGLEISRSGTATPLFANLVNSSGNATSIGFAVTSGTVKAFEETNSGVPLRESYMFFNGGLQIEWTGLTAGTAYELYLYAGGNTSGRRTNFKIDTDGDETLADETIKTIESLSTDVYLAKVIANANGTILGSAALGASTSEANWGGFQIAQVPEPSSLALLGLSLIVGGTRRRRSRS